MELYSHKINIQYVKNMTFFSLIFTEKLYNFSPEISPYILLRLRLFTVIIILKIFLTAIPTNKPCTYQTVLLGGNETFIGTETYFQTLVPSNYKTWTPLPLYRFFPTLRTAIA